MVVRGKEHGVHSPVHPCGIPALIAFAVLVCACASPGSLATESRSPACNTRVRDWSAAASRSTSVPMEPIHCTAFLARLRLSPRGSAPIDVEIAEPPGTAFRRAGRLRVSPIVDVPDFGLLPEPQRRGFGALVAWLEAHESEVAFGARRSPRPARNAYPFLLASLLLAGIALVRGSYVARTELYWGGGVFAAALLLRVLLGVWGPFHVNGQGPLWVGFAVFHHPMGLGSPSCSSSPRACGRPHRTARSSH